MNIEEEFDQYKSITLVIMDTVKSENYEKLDELFSQRQLILNNINNLNCPKEELNRLYLKSDIYNLDKILEEEINNKKEEFLNKIRESQKRKVAMNGYSNLQARAVFLSKQL